MKNKHGGKRLNAGRKPTGKTGTQYNRYVKPEWIEILDKVLIKLRIGE